jgi:hypothetical protein
MKSLSVLVVATVLVTAADQVPNQDVFRQSDGTMCGMEGTATGPDAKALDRLKNRWKNAPAAEDIDTNVSLAAMLAPGEDENRFDSAKGAQVSGFVIDVKVGGKETCNCKATAPIDRDTHIELALANDAPKNQRVIAEVTPRLRAQMKAKDVDWTTDALRAAIKGKWVKVTGLLLFDSMHFGEAENTNPGGANNWRATCWEIHPITSLEVLDSRPPGTTELPAVVLKEFHRAHVLQLQRAPERREALENRKKKILMGFERTDLDEEVP